MIDADSSDRSHWLMLTGIAFSITLAIGMLLPPAVMLWDIGRFSDRVTITATVRRALFVRAVILGGVIHVLPQFSFAGLWALFMGVAARKPDAIRWPRFIGWVCGTLAFTPVSAWLWMLGCNDLIYTWTSPSPPPCGQPFFGFLVLAVASHALAFGGAGIGWATARAASYLFTKSMT